MSALDEIYDIQFVDNTNAEAAEAKAEAIRIVKELEAELAALRAERDALKEANTHSAELLKTAKDLLDGTHGLCDEVDSEEWLWKWRVRYYLEETDIPVHEIPQDMKGDS